MEKILSFFFSWKLKCPIVNVKHLLLIICSLARFGGERERSDAFMMNGFETLFSLYCLRNFYVLQLYGIRWSFGVSMWYCYRVCKTRMEGKEKTLHPAAAK